MQRSGAEGKRRNIDTREKTVSHAKPKSCVVLLLPISVYIWWEGKQHLWEPREASSHHLAAAPSYTQIQTAGLHPKGQQPIGPSLDVQSKHCWDTGSGKGSRVPQVSCIWRDSMINEGSSGKLDINFEKSEQNTNIWERKENKRLKQLKVFF